jgi:hypothetical protein
MDALIFEYVREGNIAAIRNLFQENLASQFDVDEGGRSLLHVSLFNFRCSLVLVLITFQWTIFGGKFQLAVMKFLPECGASVHVRDDCSE